ncbi:hypothetical protein EAH_00068390, partial [Eimeria acervulina]
MILSPADVSACAIHGRGSATESHGITSGVGGLGGGSCFTLNLCLRSLLGLFATDKGTEGPSSTVFDGNLPPRPEAPAAASAEPSDMFCGVAGPTDGSCSSPILRLRPLLRIIGTRRLCKGFPCTLVDGGLPSRPEVPAAASAAEPLGTFWGVEGPGDAFSIS